MKRKNLEKSNEPSLNQPIDENNKKKKPEDISLSLEDIKKLIKKAEKDWQSHSTRMPKLGMQKLLKIIIASNLNANDRRQLLVQTLNLIPLSNKGNNNTEKRAIKRFFGLQKKLFADSLFHFALVHHDFESFSYLYTKLIKSYNTPLEKDKFQEHILSNLIEEKDKDLYEYYQLCKLENQKTFGVPIPLKDGIDEFEEVEAEEHSNEKKLTDKQAANNPATQNTQHNQSVQFRRNEGFLPQINEFFRPEIIRTQLTNLNNVTDNNRLQQQGRVTVTVNPDNKAQNFLSPPFEFALDNGLRQQLRDNKAPIIPVNQRIPINKFVPISLNTQNMLEQIIQQDRNQPENKAPINQENAQIQHPPRGQQPITGNNPRLAGLFGQNLPRINPAPQEKKYFEISDTQKFIANPQNTHSAGIHMSVTKTINDLLANISSEKSENTHEEEKLTLIQALEKENLEIFNYYWAILELKVKNESHNIFGSSSDNREAVKISKTLVKLLTSIKSQVIQREHQPQIVFENEEKLIAAWKEYAVAREVYFLLYSIHSETYLCPNTSLSAREAVVLLWSALKQTPFLKVKPPETAEEYRDHLLKVNLFDGFYEASTSPCMDGKINALFSSLNGSHLLIQIEYVNADNIPELIKTQYNQNYKILSASERNLLIKDVFKTLLSGKGSLTNLLWHPLLWKTFKSYIEQFLVLKAFSKNQLTDCLKEFIKSSSSYIDQFPEFHADCLKAIENIGIDSALVSNSLFTTRTTTASELSTSSSSSNTTTPEKSL